MKFGFASFADVPRLRRLWIDCFGDEEDYVNLFFAHSFTGRSVFVLREAENVVSMAIRFPVVFVCEDGAEQRGAYLYAVCTDPGYRGRGLCHALMREAERVLADDGCDFVCLRPDSEALSALYRGMGYAPAFASRVLTVEAGDRPATLEAVGPAAYYGLRELALRGSFVRYAPEVLAHQGRLGPLFTATEGGLFGFGAAEQYGERLILKEYLGDEALLPAIVRAFGAKRATVRMPGGEVPFAMAKALGAQPGPTGYLGLAFD